MAGHDSVAFVAPPPRSALPPAPPWRRFAAWLYTGPLGHLWSTLADIATLWAKWAAAMIRARLRRE
jgi:hypothetical protein